MRMESIADENGRLASLYALEILDTEPEPSFDRITRLARELLNVPVAKINLIDRDRQWCKSASGATRGEVARDDSFCTWTIRRDEPLVIRDTREEPFLRDFPRIGSGSRYRFYAGAPLKDRFGNNLGALCCEDFEPRSPTDAQVFALQELAHLTVEIMELRRVATTDGLTGAMTRRAFLDAAKRDVALSLRHKRSLSAIMIDLDHFKTVNDTYGHAAGDYVLSRAVALLTDRLRAADYIGRLGGEEFGLILRETSAASAHEVAERLRIGLADEVFQFGGIELRVSASLGIAALDREVADIDALLERADAALYAAKAGGRNRSVSLASEATTLA